MLHLCTAHVFQPQFLMCCFDIVSSFGFVHHPQQQNTPRPLPETAIVVLRAEQKSSSFYVTACHIFTNEAHVNKTQLSVFSHIFSAVNKEEMMKQV